MPTDDPGDWMWVITPTACYSVVQKSPGRLKIRSWTRQDLEHLSDEIGGEHAIHETPLGEYPFVMEVPTSAWADFLLVETHAIGYRNFETEALQRMGPHRFHVYEKVWAVLRDIGNTPGPR